MERTVLNMIIVLKKKRAKPFGDIAIWITGNAIHFFTILSSLRIGLAVCERTRLHRFFSDILGYKFLKTKVMNCCIPIAIE